MALYLETHSDLETLGYTKYAWVSPSEFLGDPIFTRSVDFAYLHMSNQSIYVPVVHKTVGHKDKTTTPGS